MTQTWRGVVSCGNRRRRVGDERLGDGKRARGGGGGVMVGVKTMVNGVFIRVIRTSLVWETTGDDVAVKQWRAGRMVTRRSHRIAFIANIAAMMTTNVYFIFMTTWLNVDVANHRGTSTNNDKTFH